VIHPRPGRRPSFRTGALALGLAINLGAAAWYWRAGYHHTIAVLWAASLALLIGALRHARMRRPWRWGSALREGAVLAGLLLAAAVAYLTQVGTIPFHVITDEIAIMHYMRQEIGFQPMDLFGLSYYFKFPRLIFIVFGLAAQVAGGINLHSIRLLHALCGIAVVLVTYAWMRASLPRGLAGVGALVVGGNHALVGISRLAMRDNTALLAQVGAYALLARGFQRGDLWLSLLGGMVGALSFYTYYPSRITLVVWALFLVGLLLWGRRRVPRRTVLRVGVAAAIGAVAVLSPLAVSTLKDSQPGWGFVRDQLLLFPEGREIQRQWLHAKSPADGVWRNIRNGLTLFSCPDEDRSYTYSNPGHGFFDPLTGAMVWLGLIGLLRRRSPSAAGPAWMVHPYATERFVLTGLFTLWVLFTFVVNKTPNYTRMLVLLPFAGYCAVTGLAMASRGIATAVGRLAVRPGLAPQTLTLLTAAILAWNFVIYSDYVVRGYTTQQEVGATGRYVMARKDRAPYRFMLVTSEQHPYYWWGVPDYWRYWIDIFGGKEQVVEILAPEDAVRVELAGSLTFFMARTFWDAAEPEFHRMYPGGRLHHLTPTGSHVAFEAE
jgi:4-amino-4-deoxy-L-arabinose transferase-like glycosyltransferase